MNWQQWDEITGEWREAEGQPGDDPAWRIEQDLTTPNGQRVVTERSERGHLALWLSDVPPHITTQINEDGVSGSWSWPIDHGATVTVGWDEHKAVVDVPGVGTQYLDAEDPAYLALESLVVG
jgi:hypothetical protein